MLDVVRLGGVPGGGDVGDGTYRLLFRVLASNPEEVRAFHEDTIAPLVRYDEQYGTDLVGTLEAWFEHDCSTSATAAGDLRAPPHGRLPARPREGAQRARPAQERGSRAARPRPEGGPHHGAPAARVATARARATRAAGCAAAA